MLTALPSWNEGDLLLRERMGEGGEVEEREGKEGYKGGKGREKEGRKGMGETVCVSVRIVYVAYCILTDV